MKRPNGFTVIEVIVVTLFLSVATMLLLIQRNNVAATHRDDQRKTAINAMHYALEEVYYAQNKFYPVELTSKKLSSIDPMHFTDPSGNTLGTAESQYTYEGSDCTNDACKSYTLRADLEKEADFIKTSRER